MIVDSSAIVAVLLREPGADAIIDKISSASAIGVGAPSLVEASIVLSAKLKYSARELVEEFLREIEAQIIPFQENHWPLALEAYMRFGRGRHKAALNFGDCLSYAIARFANQPLLFKGDDFSKTDLVPA